MIQYNDSSQTINAFTTQQQTVRVKPTVKKDRNTLSSADSVFFGLKDSEESTLEVCLSIKDKGIICEQNLNNETTTIHTDHKTNIKYLERGETTLHSDSSWLLIVTFISLILCGFVKLRTPYFIPSLLSSFVSEQSLKRINTTQSLSNMLPAFICQMVYYISISTIAYEIVKVCNLTPNYNGHGIKLFAVIFISIITLTRLKIILNKIIGFTFMTENTMSNINFYEVISICITGVLLLPIALLFPFTTETSYIPLTYISIAIIIILQLWRLLKSSKIVLNFYVFLYLCTVETAPILCIYKTTLLLTN